MHPQRISDHAVAGLRLKPLEKAAAKERQMAAGERGKEGGRGKKKNPEGNALKVKRAPQARDKVAKATGKKRTSLGKERQAASGGKGRIASGKLPEAIKGQSRDKVAAYVGGVSGRTVDKIKAVVAAAERDPEKCGKFVEHMDERPGRGLQRRHLDESQRAMVAARLANMKQGARTDLAPIEAMSQDTAATLLNVARTSVQRARTVIDKGTDELKHAVDQGHIAVSVAAKAAELPEASVYIRARKAVATPQAPRKQARLTHPLAQR